MAITTAPQGSEAISRDSTVRDLLARDLSRRIEPVVKVYDRANLAEDLRQFVITDSLGRELRKFLEAFAENVRSRIRRANGGDGMAVWLWGFFGSGKSHVAKVLGHVLENDIVEPEGNRRAIDLFNLHLDDPTLAAASDLKASLAEIRNHAWCKTIAFEIKSKLDQANPESVTEICLRSFYESLGLASTVWLARLERKLQAEGRYDDFLSTYRQQHGRRWVTDRLEHGFYLDEIVSALATALDRPTASARDMLTTYQRDHARVSPENFARELVDYLRTCATEVKPREPHIIFVIDEMGQYIADSSDRIHELQAIIEQAGAQGRGRIWFLCTSQEALDQVVDRTGIKLSALGKLDARFSVKIPLTGEDVRRVVQDRLLRKKEVALPALHRLYAAREGVIEDLCALRLDHKLATIDQQSFTAAYPFLPPTIALVQELFNNMRGYKLSGSERSMIGLAQGTLQDLADRPLGVIAPLDLIFDQVIDELSTADYLGTTGVKSIRESDGRIPDTPVPPSRVLKALWLISRVEWVPRTPEVIARLLAEQIDTNLAKLRDDIQETLDRLQKAGLVGRDEATGQYKYLNEKERGIEEEIVAFIQDLGSGIGVAKRRATDLLKQRVLTRAKWGEFKITLGKSGLIPFSLTLDDETITSHGEIVIRLSSPLANPEIEAIEQENMARGTKGRVIWWVAGEDTTLLDKLKRLEALDKVPERSKWKNDRSDETLRTLKEKDKERAGLEAHVAGLLESCLRNGRLYYAGEVTDLDRKKEIKGIAADFVTTVAGHLYTRFAIADRAFDERNIPTYLKSGTRSLDRLDPELGLFDAQGHLIRSSPLVETVFDELRRRKDEDLDLDGKALTEHFEKIPFGWPDTCLRLVLAAMFRGGALYLESPDSDQPVYEIASPGVETFFTGSQKFRRIRFFPTTGGLSPDEVKQAKDALLVLGEGSVPDTAQGLAERIRAHGARMVQEAEKVRQRVDDLLLPLPTTYRQAESVAQPATSLRDPVACVRQFLEDRASWKEIADFLAAYEQFVEHKRDVAFRTYVAILDYARACPSLFEGVEGGMAQEALAEFDAVVSAREVMPKWKTLQEAALPVIDCYRTFYRTELQSCVTAIAGLKREIEDAYAFTRLEESRRPSLLSTHFGSTSPLAVAAKVSLETPAELLRASESRKISELQALRMAIPGYRQAILEHCDRECAEQEKQAGVSDGSGERPQPQPQVQVFRLSIRERLSGRRFVTQAEFDAVWNALADEVAAKLAAGYEVVID